jgi:hypothetical protein
MIMYCVKDIDGNIISDIFTKKADAKAARNALLAEKRVCVVSRSADHPLGESVPETNCLNSERTSKRKKHRRSAPTQVA